MSSNHSSKKRNVEDPVPVESDAEAYRNKILRKFSVFKNKAAFMISVAHDKRLVATVLAFTYRIDIATPPITLMPNVKDSVITRDPEELDVKSITFPDKSKIKGTGLKRLGAAWRLMNEGFNGLIWATEDPSCLAAYLIPSWSSETWSRPHTDSSKDELVDVEHLYLSKSVKKLYVPKTAAIGLLNKDFISLSKMREVLEAANQVAKADASFQFNSGNLDTVLQLKDSATGRLSRGYYSTLLGAHLENTPIEDRITSFLKDASLDMCVSLAIPKSYGKRMVDTDTKAVERVKLSQADDDADLYLSDQTINSSLYSKITLDNTEVYLVNKNIPPCLKSGGGYTVIENLTKMKVKLYKSVVTSIVSKRAKRKTEGRPKTVASHDTSDDEEGTTYNF